MCSALLQTLDDIEEMADRPGEPIEPTTTSTSPALMSRIRRASTGRARDAPEPCS